MEGEEKRTSRRRFLKQLAATAAFAVGAGAFASSASAQFHCCRNCAQCGSCGQPGEDACYVWCDCSGVGESYCLPECRAPGQGCVPHPGC
jgi:hypothetical protein